MKTLNLELGTNLAKLFFVENINQEPVENYSEVNPQTVFSNENPTPNNPPWSSLAAFFVWFASIAFIILVPILFVIPYLAQQPNLLSDRIKAAEFLQNDPTALLLSIIAVIPAHILTLVLAWAVVTKLNKFSFFETLGWKWGGFNVWNCLLILAVIFIVAAVTSYYVPEQDNDLLRILRSSRAAVFVVAFLATFTAPLVEEVIYRGVLYSAFQKNFGVIAGVVLTTLFFALVHVPQYYPSYSTIFLIVLLSLVLTLIRVRTKNLLPCVILHMIFNGIQSILLILQPYFENANPQEKAAAFIHLIK
ncbi:MAG: type II CAAX endopeptidase family protein [Acidobacteriota bacterium]